MVRKKTLKKPSFEFEDYYWQKGYEYIIGADEVGRGAFAGPVVVASVIFPKNIKIDGINDSKLLSPQKREVLFEVIIKNAFFYSIDEVSVSIINKHGIGKATQTAFRKSIRNILQKLLAYSSAKHPQLLVDGFYIPYVKGMSNKFQTPIIKGDQKSVSIAAASILAKVYRDNVMKKLHTRFPKYRFDIHKGYGTKFHQEMIKKHGLCPLHRTSFNLSKFM